MREDYTMRAAKLDDMKFLLELRIETMGPHLKSANMALTNDNHKERILHNFEQAKIILLKNEKIGLLKLLKSENEYQIEQIQIKKKYQGNGIGKSIIANIIGKAEVENIPVKLSVLKENKAKYLYKSLGFKINGEDKDSFLMIKS